MVEIKRKIINFIKKTGILKKIEYQSFISYFLFKMKEKPNKFKITIDTKCLVLSQYPGAEIKGLGGLIAQYPKNFEILCFTNGSTMLKEFDTIKSASIKKQQFIDAMKTLRVKGSKIFDIDSETLKNHYSTFRKIDISEADYIFIPNIYDNNKDTLALLEHFKNILKEKEYKPSLKIIMYEFDFALCAPNYLVDISSIIETKKRTLDIYYPKEEYQNYVNKILGLNAFRAHFYNYDFCETFMGLSYEEFIKIPLLNPTSNH